MCPRCALALTVHSYATGKSLSTTGELLIGHDHTHYNFTPGKAFASKATPHAGNFSVYFNVETIWLPRLWKGVGVSHCWHAKGSELTPIGFISCYRDDMRVARTLGRTNLSRPTINSGGEKSCDEILWRKKFRKLMFDRQIFPLYGIYINQNTACMD